ncbi:hypothetical protein AAMO2058_000792200 [Amorphochlora amoebiformis]
MHKILNRSSQTDTATPIYSFTFTLLTSGSKNALPPRVAKRASYASSREQSRGCRLGYSTAWIRVGRFGAGHTWLDAETEYIRPDV